MQCVQNFQVLAISSFAAAQQEVGHVHTYGNVGYLTIHVSWSHGE